MATEKELIEFSEKVWAWGEKLYRDLPWRGIDDPYAVLVSEVMLQQTQVSRVLKYWEAWMHKYPTLDALAAADVSDVLESWQGLGYNRRALALKKTAEICSEQYGGKLPETKEELLALPGIGPATCAGVCAFAWNRPGVYLETNVRSVFIHELFPAEEEVSDKLLNPLVEQTCSQENPRMWYYALLDYGAYLKKISPNPSRRSKHYAKQSKFEGSRRQKRAELVRIIIAEQNVNENELFALLNEEEQKAGREAISFKLFESIANDLVSEGFFKYNDSTYSI